MNTLHTAFSLVLLLAGLAGARPPDSFVIRVQPAARRADLQVRTFITGTFGAVGGFQSTPIDDDGVLINAEYGGKPAETLKAVLYMPGCEMQLIRDDHLQTSTRESEFHCEPLATIPLNARIDPSAIPPDEDAYVEVSYLGSWAHSFFKILDGITMTLAVAEAPVAPDGSFTIALPDFASDPISVGIGKDAYLFFILRSRNTGNSVAFLQPDQSVRSQTGDLKIGAAYPSSVGFTAHPLHQ